MKSDRIRELEEFIRVNDTVSLGEICSRFGISMNTVRRDIAELAKKGTVKKIYGGVSSVNKSLIPFDERNVKHSREKMAIAKAAAALVEDRDIIFIDSGTTTHNMVSFLRDKSITIVTHSLNVIVDALPHENLSVIAMGGSLVRKTNSFSGVHTPEALQDLNINKAFLAATGLSLASGATNSSPLEYEIKKSVAEKSRFTCLLVDSSKFGVSSLMTYCRIPGFDAVVTDRAPQDEYRQQFEENGVRLIVAR